MNDQSGRKLPVRVRYKTKVLIVGKRKRFEPKWSSRLVKLRARSTQTMQERGHERILPNVKSKHIDIVLRPRPFETRAQAAKGVFEQGSIQGGVHGRIPGKGSR